MKFKVDLNFLIIRSMGPIISCDGGGSITRKILKKKGFLNYIELKCPQGYKELIFPKGNTLSKKGLHIWPRGNHFLMALENLDGSFTGTIYINDKGFESFEELNTKKNNKHLF